jgi:hypothetical protein
VERGLQLSSCAYRFAGRWESAREWVRECIYQGLIFPCVLCSICGRAKKKRSSVVGSYSERDSTSQGHVYRSGGQEAEGSSRGDTGRTWTGFLQETALATRETGVQIKGLVMCGKKLLPRVFPPFHSERNSLL